MDLFRFFNFAWAYELLPYEVKKKVKGLKRLWNEALFILINAGYFWGEHFTDPHGAFDNADLWGGILVLAVTYKLLLRSKV